jgi:nicotine blue oxidoreductase
VTAPPEVWAGVLAAGAGRRLGGRPKATLDFRGTTFLETIVRTARRAGVAGVAVVLGHHARDVRGLAASLCDRVADNPDPDRGMGSSARVLAGVVPDGAALLLWPVDMPAVRTETIAALIEVGRLRPDNLVVPTTGGRAGHPPLLPPRLVDALRRLGDDERLDVFVARLGGAPCTVLVDDPGVVRDVDHTDDLDALQEGT